MRLGFVAAAMLAIAPPVFAQTAVAQPAIATSEGIFPISQLGNYQAAGIARSARAALIARDYAGARREMDWLTGSTTMLSPDVLVIAGLIDAGLNDLGSAQNRFATALAHDRHHLGARTGLALTLAHRGQRDAAARQLRGLEARRRRCAGHCADAATLDQAVTAVRRAVGA